MLYELRIYDIVPGRMPDINSRFANITIGLFQKHGIRPVAFWENVIGPSNQLIYMLAWESLAEREEKWGKFSMDPDWLKGRAATEKNGPIVTRSTNTMLRPTSYSPMK